MTRLLRTELLRLRTTRAAWALVGLFLALTVARMVLLSGSIGTLDGPPPGSAQVRDLYVGSGGLAALLLPMLLGALATAGEFQHHTLTWSVLVVPDRRRLVVAKVLSSAVIGFVIGAALILLGIAVAVAAGAGRHVDASFLIRIGGLPLMSAWAGAFGACVGTVLRNASAAAVAPLVWFVVAEALLAAFPLDWLLPWTPGGATTALSGADRPGLLQAWAAAMMLLAYAAAVGIPGTRHLMRADIT